jgi:hypothetical protein
MIWSELFPQDRGGDVFFQSSSVSMNAARRSLVSGFSRDVCGVRADHFEKEPVGEVSASILSKAVECGSHEHLIGELILGN